MHSFSVVLCGRICAFVPSFFTGKIHTRNNQYHSYNNDEINIFSQNEIGCNDGYYWTEVNVIGQYKCIELSHTDIPKHKAEEGSDDAEEQEAAPYIEL